MLRPLFKLRAIWVQFEICLIFVENFSEGNVSEIALCTISLPRELPLSQLVLPMVVAWVGDLFYLVPMTRQCEHCRLLYVSEKLQGTSFFPNYGNEIFCNINAKGGTVGYVVNFSIKIDDPTKKVWAILCGELMITAGEKRLIILWVQIAAWTHPTPSHVQFNCLPISLLWKRAFVLFFLHKSPMSPMCVLNSIQAFSWLLRSGGRRMHSTAEMW